MSERTDAELLREAAEGARQALGQIAQRYIGFVFNTALRQVHDRHLAEDITQAVFVIFFSKIRHLNPQTLLHGWFFTTTRFAASNALKLRARRARHERQAAAMRHEMTTSSEPDAITPLLDQALAGLGEAERDAVLLSYFGCRGWREVAAAIGTSEEVARKRVERAIMRMRRFFQRRGVVVSSAALVETMRSNATAAAPLHLMQLITSSLVAPTSTAAASGLAATVINMMALAKLKMAAVYAIVIVAAISAAGTILLSQVRAEDSSSAPVVEHAVTVEDFTVELIGIADYPEAKASWRGDGSRRDKPLPLPEDHGISQLPAPSMQLVVRVSGAHVMDLSSMLGMQWKLLPERGTVVRTNFSDSEATTTIAFPCKEDQKTVDLRVLLATGQWEVAAARDGTEGMMVIDGVAFGEVHDVDGMCATTITDSALDRQARIVAIDINAQEHHPVGISVGHGNGFRQASVKFAIPPADIDRIEFRTRPYNEWVEFRNISLIAAQNNGFEIKSSDQP